MIAALCFTLMSTLAHAAEFEPVSTADFVYSEQGQAAIERVETALANEEVKAKLVAYGLSEVEAKERLASLTPAEADQLAKDIDELPKAGSELTVLLLVVIIILLLN